MKLSIIIPAREEEFLINTIEDILLHSKLGGDLEVLVGLDGLDGTREEWASSHPLSNTEERRVKLFANKEPQGQRATQNRLAKKSEAKYIMKTDAHCSFSQGFDKKMVEIMEANPDIVLVPALGNLWAYDWLCPKGHRTYQGKVDKCSQCDSTELKKDLVWKVKGNLLCSDFYFNDKLLFTYGDFENYEMLHPVKAVQGSGFMVSRENYFKWDLCDESWGSWGQQGFEVYTKTIKNGGRVLCTREACMGHLFRKTDEFPYERDDAQITHAYEMSKELFAK